MELTHIELSKLIVSPANMRASRKAPDISDLLPSVRARGILVPLLVRPSPVPSQTQADEPDCYEVVAGRRRYHAALAVAEEGGEVEPLPCAIIEAGDDAAALEASLIENIARLDPDEVTQWVTFTKLVKQGRSIGDIAGTFGLTEQQVKRILALGNLHPRIRQLYRQEQIDAASIRHLTLATRAKQEEWLALYRDPESYAPLGQHLKQWLFGGASIATKVALFDLADYPAPIVADLFGEDSYFSDADAFWTLQHRAIAELRDSYVEAGWTDVVILEAGDYFHRWDHEKVSKAKGGKVHISVSRQGEVEAHEGWLTRKEARRIEKAGSDEPMPEKVARSEVTASLQSYIDLHRHAAVRAELLGHPAVALRLMVAHVIAGSWLWSVRVEPQRAPSDAIAESIETSPAEAAFDAKRREVLQLLGFDAEQPTVVGGYGYEADLPGFIERLMGLADEEVMTVLTVVMGETLAAGHGMVEALGVYLGIDMARYWTADQAFLDLVRDRKALIAMLDEVAEPGVADANAKEKVKTIKRIIDDHLTGSNGRTKVENWVPRWLRFPAASYIDREYRCTAEREAGVLEDAGLD